MRSVGWTTSGPAPSLAGALLRILIVAPAFLPLPASAWRTWGVLPVHKHFAIYLGKFCFDYTSDSLEPREAGQFTITVQGKVEPDPEVVAGVSQTSGQMYLMVFDDEQEHWQRVRQTWGDLTCESLLRDACANCVYPIGGVDGSYNRTVLISESTRPRFWYFTFVACGVTVVKPLVYELHTENVWQGLEAEFSFDERGNLDLQLFGAFAFVFVAYWLRQTARNATGAEAFRARPLLRTMLASSLCSGAGASCLALHYSMYAANGYGAIPFQVAGQICICMAKGLLTLLQLLTAKGWALFYEPAELGRRRLLSCILAGVVILSFTCEIHADYYHDWSATLYLYESGPGFLILLMNVILYLEAWRSMRETYRHEMSSEVRAFHIMISLASFMYFLTLPLMTLLALTLDPWVRAKYVGRAEVISRLIATVLLCYCLRPSNLEVMVNARLEDGLETVGELRDDIDLEAEDSPNDYGIEDKPRYDRDDEASEQLLKNDGKSKKGRHEDTDFLPAE